MHAVKLPARPPVPLGGELAEGAMHLVTIAIAVTVTSTSTSTILQYLLYHTIL